MRYPHTSSGSKSLLISLLRQCCSVIWMKGILSAHTILEDIVTVQPNLQKMWMMNPQCEVVLISYKWIIEKLRHSGPYRENIGQEILSYWGPLPKRIWATHWFFCAYLCVNFRWGNIFQGDIWHTRTSKGSDSTKVANNHVTSWWLYDSAPYAVSLFSRARTSKMDRWARIMTLFLNFSTLYWSGTPCSRLMIMVWMANETWGTLLTHIRVAVFLSWPRILCHPQTPYIININSEAH